LTLEQRIARLEKIILLLFSVLPSGWRLLMPKGAAESIQEIEAEARKEQKHG
jgi:hypothetical protein